MINLIPPAAKKSILVEYWVRVVSVWLMLWSVALFASASVLLPAYVLIGSQVEVHETSAALVSQKVADYDNVSVALIDASQQAAMVVDETESSLFSEYLLLFESLQGEGAQVTSVKMSRGEESTFTPVTVEGVASDRQALASFRDRLLFEDVVESVDLPISNLTRDKDISFTITVTLINPTDI